MDGRMDRWAVGQMDGQRDGWTAGQARQRDRWIVGLAGERDGLDNGMGLKMGQGGQWDRLDNGTGWKMGWATQWDRPDSGMDGQQDGPESRTHGQGDGPDNGTGWTDNRTGWTMGQTGQRDGLENGMGQTGQAGQRDGPDSRDRLDSGMDRQQDAPDSGIGQRTGRTLPRKGIGILRNASSSWPCQNGGARLRVVPAELWGWHQRFWGPGIVTGIFGVPLLSLKVLGY